MTEMPQPTRTPNSASDSRRDFRCGCIFLVVMVLLLWAAVWAIWAFWVFPSR